MREIDWNDNETLTAFDGTPEEKKKKFCEALAKFLDDPKKREFGITKSLPFFGREKKNDWLTK